MGDLTANSLQRQVTTLLEASAFMGAADNDDRGADQRVVILINNVPVAVFTLQTICTRQWLNVDQRMMCQLAA